LHIRQLASREDAPCITGLADCGLYERAKVAATPQLILDSEPALRPQARRPLCVDLAFEIEGTMFISEVAGYEHECKCDPGEEGVPGQEATVVKEDTGPADDGGEDTYAGGDGGKDEFRVVARAYDIGVFPNVEPREETDDQGSQ